MKTELEIHGHRGCRGHYPENTINGFFKAIELGAEVIEMDVVISKDLKVIVSHEPYMNHEISLDPSGNKIPKELERNHNIFKMSYDELKKYDVGSTKHLRFPEQENVIEFKPSLESLISEIEKAHPSKIKYNIEIKRNPIDDGIYHPDYKTFSDLVSNTIIDHGIVKRCTFQSFDLDVLSIFKSNLSNNPNRFIDRRYFLYQNECPKTRIYT